MLTTLALALIALYVARFALSLVRMVISLLIGLVLCGLVLAAILDDHSTPTKQEQSRWTFVK